MAQQGQVTKIYQLKTVGFSTIHDQLQQIAKDFAEIKKQKSELEKLKLNLSGNDLAKVNSQIVQLDNATKKLEGSMKALNQQSEFSASRMTNLLKTYREAKNRAEDLAVEYGIESQAAKEAAAAADLYAKKISDIRNFVKSGGQSNSSADVPFTHNLSDLQAEQEAIQKTGEVVNDFERQQAAAANEATQLSAAAGQSAESITQAGESLGLVTTKYSEYTGTLRDNIRVQLENQASLEANRATQKQIDADIAKTGRASETQTNKLIALKEEEQLLIETNKALTVTIRNQAKEFIASNGSLDEMQAQLNQIQQSYEQLSEAEKAAPFGQGLKKEIDELEPKVKSLEYELGKFGRNVGNYPTTFTAAFTVLNKELDEIKGKVVNGDFVGKDLEQLTGQQKALEEITAKLGGTFNSTSQEANAYKEAGRQIAQIFGADSEIFKLFSAQVLAGNTALKEADKQLVNTSASGKKFTGVLSTLYGGIRRLANIIPGLGISGVVLLLLAPLQSLATWFAEVGKKAIGAKTDVKDFEKEIKLTNQALDESVNEFVKAFTNVEELRIKIEQAKKGLISKRAVLEEYNSTIGKTTGQVTSLDQAEKDLVKNGEAYVKMTLYKAAANIALEKAAKKLFEAEQTSRKKAEEFNNVVADTRVVGFGSTSFNPEEYDADTKRIQDAQEKRKQDAIDNANAEKDGLINIANKFQEEAAAIAKKFKFSLNGDYGTKNNQFEESLKRIDLERQRQIAVEKQRVFEIQKIRELSFQEEKDHLLRLQAINIDALEKKSKLYDQKKKLDINDKKSIAEIGQEKAQTVVETLNKITDLEKTEYEKRIKTLQANLQDELNAIDEKNKAIQEKESLSALDKVKAQVQTDESELEARKKFYDEIIALNSEFNKEEAKKAKSEIDELEKTTASDRLNVTKSSLQDLKRESDAKVTQIETDYSRQRKVILDNEKLTADQKKKQIDELNKAEKRTILSAELDALNKEVAIKKILLEKDLITNEEYLQAVAEQVKKAEQLSENINSDSKPKSIRSAISKLFGFDEGSAGDQTVGKLLSESYQLATDAMNNYFDAEQQRIQDNLDLQLQRIETEKDQVIARAQSQAEIDSIEKQYEAKKKAEEQKAHEELKRSKKSEAKIALASELANIWASVWQLGPVAAPIAGALFSALALGRYALRVSEINREKFEFGGAPTKRGGVAKGPSHADGGIPFNYDYEAEGKELFIINKRSAEDKKVRTITGTNKQIASAVNVLGGGVAFDFGAKVKKFDSGGFLGQSLQPPVFQSSIVNSISNDGKMNELIDSVKDLKESVKDLASEQSKRIDRLKVIQDPKEVNDAINKRVKQEAAGTLGSKKKDK